MATAALIPGLPPHFLDRLDQMTPDYRSETILRLAKADMTERRKHSRMRNSLLRSDGIDIGPYLSLYDALWKDYRRLIASQSNEYPVLGLDFHEDVLTKREVKNAYRRQARKLHPDVGGDAESFKQLHTAYRRLLAVATKE
jgi:hypothetical protein